MLIINLGFPKTSTTNLQKNFYPKLKKINYLGRRYDKESKLFKDLNAFVEKRKKFSKKEYKNLYKSLNKIIKNKRILISNENWITPFQKNYYTNKFEIVSQYEKLKNLNMLLKDAKINYKIFLIKRNKFESFQSIFVTLNKRIGEIFGEEYRSIDYYLYQLKKKNENYNNLKLIFDIYSISKIKKIFPKNKITIFNYKLITNNPMKFIKELSSYLGIRAQFNLISELKLQVNVTRKHNEKYFTLQKNFFGKFLKFIIPFFILKKFNFLLKYDLINRMVFKKQIFKKNKIKNKLKKY